MEDRSHTPHHLQTRLTPEQEVVVVELRRTLLLPLDDLLVVTREFLNPEVSRSGLDRCLRRHGVSNLRKLKAGLAEAEGEESVAKKAFRGYEPGFIHIDVKYLPLLAGEKRRRYLFVAIDRATRWVFLQVKTSKTARAARAFLRAVVAACPVRIRKVLTDNGKEFTDRFTVNGERKPTGNHLFDRECAAQAIEHRLIPPRRPQTNGMVERFNGRISEILAAHHCDSHDDLDALLRRYMHLYSSHSAAGAGPQNAHPGHEGMAERTARHLRQASAELSGT